MKISVSRHYYVKLSETIHSNKLCDATLAVNETPILSWRHWDRNNIATILQTTFLISNFLTENMCVLVQMFGRQTIIQHWHTDDSLAPTKQQASHYNDVIMGAMASQIISLTIVFSMVYSSADQRKHQRSASLAFVRGIHRWPVNSPHKGPVTRKTFPFDEGIMSTQINNGPVRRGFNIPRFQYVMECFWKTLKHKHGLEATSRYEKVLISVYSACIKKSRNWP